MKHETTKICEYCGEEFHFDVTKQSIYNFQTRRYCGLSCSGKGTNRATGGGRRPANFLGEIDNNAFLAFTRGKQ